MMKNSYFISLIVPVFNEQEVIEKTIQIYNSHLSKFLKKYEIIIVDDGSTDQTPKILQLISKKIPELQIVTHPTNYGVGKALLDGFNVAHGKWVMHNSADRPFNMKELSKVFPLMKNSDVIVIVRKDRSANSIFRKITSLVSYFLIKLFFGTPIQDFHFIQIYKKNILNSVHIKASDTFLPAELLVKLYKKEYRFKQFQAVFHRRTEGYSKYNNPIRYIRYLKDLINLWLEIKKEDKKI